MNPMPSSRVIDPELDNLWQQLARSALATPAVLQRYAPAFDPHALPMAYARSTDAVAMLFLLAQDDSRQRELNATIRQQTFAADHICWHNGLYHIEHCAVTVGGLWGIDGSNGQFTRTGNWRLSMDSRVHFQGCHINMPGKDLEWNASALPEAVYWWTGPMHQSPPVLLGRNDPGGADRLRMAYPPPAISRSRYPSA